MKLLFKYCCALIAVLAGGIFILVASLAVAQTVVEVEGKPISLFAGEGKLIRVDTPSESVFLANPEVADVEVKSPNLLYIYGKQMGETTLFIIDDANEVSLSSNIKVTSNIAALNGAAKAAVIDGNFSVVEAEGALFLRGRVPTLMDAQQVEAVVRKLAGETVPLVNSLALDTPAQVNLQVKIAEVSRTVSEELGTSWTALAGDDGFSGGASVPGGYALTTSITAGNELLGVSLEALKSKGLVTILSEPNLTARSGDKASFLAGGRFPYQTQSSDDDVRVVFEPFGVELEFEPEVMQSNKIKLIVSTKIRELDFSNGSQTGTQNVPLILERSAATTIEVGSGQSFAIAGLFKSNSQQDVNEVPGLGDIPILGNLFKSTRYQAGESELVILVTPYLVEPAPAGEFKTPVDNFSPSQSLRPQLLGGGRLGTSAEAPNRDAGGNVASVKRLNGKAGLLLQ